MKSTRAKAKREHAREKPAACDQAKRLCFKASQIKMRRSILTIPSAWNFAPMTEVAFELKTSKARAPREKGACCHGIVLECRPQKNGKERYEMDLVLTQVPRCQIHLFDELRPHLPLCLEISCSECRWYRTGLANTRGDCASIQRFKQQIPV